MPNDLTFKQRLWLQEYILSGNATDAAMKVYECKKRETAQVLGSKNLKSLRENIADSLEEAGITDAKLFKRLDEGLDSIKDRGSKPDAFVRHMYLQTALKLKKVLVDRSENTNKVDLSECDEAYKKRFGGKKSKETPE